MNFSYIKLLVVSVLLVWSTDTAVSTVPDESYDSFLKEALEGYNGFRDSMNQEYADFLKQPWSSGKLRDAIKKREEPPVPIKRNDDRDRNYDDIEFDFEKVNPVKPPKPQPEPVEPIPDVVIDKPLVTSVLFYGTPLEFNLDRNMTLSLSINNENSVSNAWRYLSDSAGATKLLNELLFFRKTMMLGDWAYYQLIDKLSKTVFKSTGSSRLFTGWAMAQSGYSVRFAFADSGELLTLIGTDDIIYGYSGLNLNGLNYYFFHEKPSSNNLRFTEKDFPGSKSFSLRYANIPKFAFKSAGKKALTVKHYPEIKVEMEANQNLLDYYGSIPRSSNADNQYTQWVQYADTPISEHNRDLIYPVLKKAIAGKSVHDSANIIMDFCESFDYKLDDEMWGGDRPLYPDEMLHYFYSDCEDHAILFTRIIRDLLGLQTGLIYYPGHLAALAVFDEPISGDHYILHGKKWMVCDPTYFYVGVGKQMPNVDASKAVLIPL